MRAIVLCRVVRANRKCGNRHFTFSEVYGHFRKGQELIASRPEKTAFFLGPERKFVSRGAVWASFEFSRGVALPERM